MSISLEKRTDGSMALFIDGDLQFDSRDEALYHESLVLPALTLASRSAEDMRVLICGGGDGLALRECLRFPGVSKVDLVDYSEEVVKIGRTELAELNNNAFADARTTVYVEDAWNYLKTSPKYDVIVCDLTVPRKPEEAHIFTLEWYQAIANNLKTFGFASINGFSPQVTPEAFWCLHNTVEAAELNVAPFRVCIPSFREQGYGVWSFMLASKRPLEVDLFKHLHCPIPTQQADISRLYRGASFSRKSRQVGQSAPIHSLEKPCLLSLLLNPQPHKIDVSNSDVDYDLNPLIASIPTLHPQHTRDMIETLTRQVAGYVQNIDLRELVDSLLLKTASLSDEIVRELRKLKEWLGQKIQNSSSIGTWSAKLFAVLVITMTLANAVAPDNAFAKGGAGLGHASMSRGFSGGFGGGRGAGASSASASRGGSAGFSGGGRSTFSPSSVHVSGPGYRAGSYGHTYMTDIYGYTYRPRIFNYYGGYGYGYGGYGNRYIYHSARPAPKPTTNQPHQSVFVADEDMLVLDNGDIIINLSPESYMLLTTGTLSLMSVNSMEPLAPLAIDEAFLATLKQELTLQKEAVSQQIKSRQDWVGWVGWTSSLFANVRDDKAEIANMEDLTHRIDLAFKQIGSPKTTSGIKPDGSFTELFVGGFLLDDGNVKILQPDGSWLETDGKTIRPSGAVKSTPCPPELLATLRSILVKLQKELTADQLSNKNDIAVNLKDKQALDIDMASYQSIFSANSFDGQYEVDYGTSSIPVTRAISLTQKDIDDNLVEAKNLEKDQQTTDDDLARISRLLPIIGAK